MDSQSLALFTGNANPALAHDIARHMRVPAPWRSHVARGVQRSPLEAALAGT